MDSLPPVLAAQTAIAKQNVAMSMIKASAKADQMIANILEDSAQMIASSNRGGNVNFTA